MADIVTDISRNKNWNARKGVPTLGKIMYIGAFWNALDSKWDTRYTEEV